MLSDEEGNNRMYSYEKLLGIKSLSDTDRDNISQGKDNTLDRTRRLFYVCCSRSLKDLAVVLFTADVEHAIREIGASEIFDQECVKTEIDI